MTEPVPLHYEKKLGNPFQEVRQAKILDRPDAQQYAAKRLINVTPERFEHFEEAQFYRAIGDRDFHDTHIVIPIAYHRVAEDEKEHLELIFPFLHGGDLGQLLADNQRLQQKTDRILGQAFLSKDEVQRFIHGVLRAFQVAHSQLGFSHRELKSDQILLDHGEFYIADWASTRPHLRHVYKDKEWFTEVISTLLLGPEVIDGILAEMRRIIQKYEQLDPSKSLLMRNFDLRDVRNEFIKKVIGEIASHNDRNLRQYLTLNEANIAHEAILLAGAQHFPRIERELAGYVSTNETDIQTLDYYPQLEKRLHEALVNDITQAETKSAGTPLLQRVRNLLNKKPVPHEVVPIDTVEQPNAVHIVGRRKVQPIVFEQEMPNPETDAPFNEQNLDELQSLATQYAEKIEATLDQQYVIFDTDFLQRVADMVNQDFSFTIQGSGVATLGRQFDAYRHAQQKADGRSLTDEAKRELRKHLDCKLATIMTALIINKLAERHHTPIKIDIVASQPEHPHPRLKVAIGSDGNTELFSIDSIVEIGKNELTGEQYDPTYDWEGTQDHSQSNILVIKIGKAVLEVFDKRYPFQSPLLDSHATNQTEMAIKSLQTLDESFRRA